MRSTTERRAIDDMQRFSNGAFERLASRATALRDRAEPMIDRVTSSLHDNAERVRWQVGRASDRSVAYMRDRPLASALIAGAVGALVFVALRSALLRDR